MHSNPQPGDLYTFADGSTKRVPPPFPATYLTLKGEVAFDTIASSLRPGFPIVRAWTANSSATLSDSNLTYLIIDGALMRVPTRGAASHEYETRKFFDYIEKNRHLLAPDLADDIDEVLLANPSWYYPGLMSFDRRMDLMCEMALYKLFSFIGRSGGLKVRFIGSDPKWVPSAMLQAEGRLIRSVLPDGVRTGSEYHYEGHLKVFATEGITLDVPDGQTISLAPRPRQTVQTTFLGRLATLVKAPVGLVRWLFTGRR